MDGHFRDLADLALRWVHLIAGIMWVGNSMLFNWLDRNLVRKEGAPKEHEGTLWLVHSGGFYEIEKKQLAPSELPKDLHWFKWQAGITWLTGASLLVLVYYLGAGGAVLVDPAVRAMGQGTAVAASLGLLVGGFVLYDRIWRSPLRKTPRWGVALSGALLAGFVWVFLHVFAARAAYLHTGALLGTLMAANVWTVIVPSQVELVTATREGRPQNKEVGLFAKERSIHNNYMTFPLLIIMLSAHFPATWGGRSPALSLAILMISGALLRHFMNIRFHYPGWLKGFVAVLAAGISALYWVTRPAKIASASGDTVPFSEVSRILANRCTACHSMQPTDPSIAAAPNGVTFDNRDQIRTHAERIHFRAVVQRTMPLINKTGMSDEERALIDRWFAQGARTAD